MITSKRLHHHMIDVPVRIRESPFLPSLQRKVTSVVTKNSNNIISITNINEHLPHFIRLQVINWSITPTQMSIRHHPLTSTSIHHHMIFLEDSINNPLSLLTHLLSFTNTNKQHLHSQCHLNISFNFLLHFTISNRRCNHNFKDEIPFLSRHCPHPLQGKVCHPHPFLPAAVRVQALHHLCRSSKI